MAMWNENILSTSEFCRVAPLINIVTSRVKVYLLHVKPHQWFNVLLKKTDHIASSIKAAFFAASNYFLKSISTFCTAHCNLIQLGHSPRTPVAQREINQATATLLQAYNGRWYTPFTKKDGISTDVTAVDIDRRELQS